MSDVSLNAGIRSNLLQLQSSSQLFQRTTERLASGKKVNSAIDSPTNFFAAVNLTDRAEGLSARLDGIGQAIQTVKAADNGISTIRSFISAAKGVVNSAIGNSDADERDSLGRQFNELLVQISQTAKDSDYQGVNLLQGNATNTIQFGEQFDDSKLDILGFDVGGPGADGLAEVDADGNIASAAETAVVNVASVASVASTAAVASAASVASDSVSVVASSASVASAASSASAASIASVGATGYTATDNSVTAELVGQTGYTVTNNSAAAVETIGTASAASEATAASVASVASAASATQATQASAASTASVASAAGVASAAAATETAAVAVFLGNQTGGTTVGIQGAGANAGSVDFGGTNYQNDLAAIVQQLEAFDSELKIQAGALSQNLAAITIREEFSNDLINTLNEGADKLTLADLNEEGANLLALQTSTQLATQSLALASQQSQGVLQLLG